MRDASHNAEETRTNLRDKDLQTLALSTGDPGGIRDTPNMMPESTSEEASGSPRRIRERTYTTHTRESMPIEGIWRVTRAGSREGHVDAPGVRAPRCASRAEVPKSSPDMPEGYPTLPHGAWKVGRRSADDPTGARSTCATVRCSVYVRHETSTSARTPQEPRPDVAGARWAERSEVVVPCVDVAREVSRHGAGMSADGPGTPRRRWVATSAGAAGVRCQAETARDDVHRQPMERGRERCPIQGRRSTTPPAMARGTLPVSGGCGGLGGSGGDGQVRSRTPVGAARVGGCQWGGIRPRVSRWTSTAVNGVRRDQACARERVTGVAADIGVCNVKMSPERSGRQQDPIHPTAKGGKAPEP